MRASFCLSILFYKSSFKAQKSIQYWAILRRISVKISKNWAKMQQKLNKSFFKKLNFVSFRSIVFSIWANFIVWCIFCTIWYAIQLFFESIFRPFTVMKGIKNSFWCVDFPASLFTFEPSFVYEKNLILSSFPRHRSLFISSSVVTIYTSNNSCQSE